MRLEQLLRQLPGADVRGSLQQDVSAVTYDSRRVQRGSLFVAIPGFAADGHDFIDDAIAGGATVIVGERISPLPPQATFVQVPDSRAALAALAAAFYGHPSGKLRLIGVTGTNGKTTTTFLIRAILEAAGHQTGLVGTVCNYVGQEMRPVERTTPESPDLQLLLADMVMAGCTHAVMEVSSHALALGRVDHCDFDAAVFTNFSQDHLDFHQSLESYREAKLSLFRRTSSYAIINGDDPTGPLARAACHVPVHEFGLQHGTVRAEDIVVGTAGVAYTLVWPGGRLPIKLGLPGRFNVYNSLAAAAAALAEGVAPAVIAMALAAVRPVPGRLEAVYAGQDFTVFVDYAHTPDGLATVLHTARELQSGGRIILVFGCGGDRDRGKRPLMGRLAGALADYTIITSDNPRSEDPDAIIAAIVAGLEVGGVSPARYVTEPDRVKAIGQAIAMARTGDIVLIAGKGHETVQVFADRTIHFDDRVVAANLLQQRLGLSREAAGGDV